MSLSILHMFFLGTTTITFVGVIWLRPLGKLVFGVINACMLYVQLEWEKDLYLDNTSDLHAKYIYITMSGLP